MTATHPFERELQDFLLGKLVDSDHFAVEAHVVECGECGVRALDAPGQDTLTELLASARTRANSVRLSAATPMLAGSETPSLFAPTLAWEGSDSTPVAPSDVPASIANHPKYRVVRRLGIGGMGTVWLAEHTVMNRMVAVKVIRPDLLARPGAAGRFLREVRAAAKLHHRNIVTAFDAEQAGDSCLLVMEYVDGKTLADLIHSGPLPVPEACQAIRDAARGLAHAHAAGLVHRDVKPHNLIQASDGTVKVLDFGLTGVASGEIVAANGDGLTGAGMVVGTPAYIAPEHARAAAVIGPVTLVRTIVWLIGPVILWIAFGCTSALVVFTRRTGDNRDPRQYRDTGQYIAAIDAVAVTIAVTIAPAIIFTRRFQHAVALAVRNRRHRWRGRRGHDRGCAQCQRCCSEIPHIALLLPGQ